MIAALINHLWQSTLFLRRRLVDHAGLACQWRGAAPLGLVAGLAQIPGALLAAVLRGLLHRAARGAHRRHPAPVFGDALQSVALLVSPSALRATESARVRSCSSFCWQSGSAAPSWSARAGCSHGAPRITGKGSAAGAGRISGCTHHGRRHRAGRGARFSSGGVAAGRVARATLATGNRRGARPRTRTHRAQDNLKDGVHRLVETLFWFHPAVWWIGRQMIEERERACDEAVLAVGHDGGDYASGILAVCRHCSAGGQVLPRPLPAISRSACATSWVMPGPARWA